MPGHWVWLGAATLAEIRRKSHVTFFGALNNWFRNCRCFRSNSAGQTGFRPEIRLLRHRHVIVEEIGVVLLADELAERPIAALIALIGPPGLDERVGVVHGDVHF